jgi:glycosyltransferase involved in cell wall biosynthesis
LIHCLSVIIPTRNRAKSLKVLLDSLQSAARPNSTKVEIIVVNNGSTDETSQILNEEAGIARPLELVVLHQPIPGKANAINLALTVARGEILMIVDDDVSIHPQCLVKHLDAYEQSSFSAVQGKVQPGRDPEGQCADLRQLQKYNIPLVDYGDAIIQIQGLTGTNMSFKREVLERIGAFDVRLGPGAAGFSEDTEFSMRIRRAGFKIGYTPHAIVYHELNPQRYGRAYNRDVEYRKGLSRSLYRQDSITFKVLPNLLANCLRYGVYLALGRSQKAYRTEGRIMKCCGYLMGKLPPYFSRRSS